MPTETEVDLSYLKGKTVAILGYENHGYDHAQKLRLSGIPVLVVLREGTSNEKWEEDGLHVVSVWEAVEKADVIQVW